MRGMEERERPRAGNPFAEAKRFPRKPNFMSRGRAEIA
jgi:hypothetical protein